MASAMLVDFHPDATAEVFRHDDDQIFIVAVAHVKRRPGFWRDR
jgi:hypothetical protein